MKILLSTVTPVYQGASYLKDLVEALESARKAITDSYVEIELAECIFVIDESRDNSGEILESLAQEREWINVIELSKNYGQHPATVAGILHSSGQWVFTLDEDLQHHPDHILPMLKDCLASNRDVYYALPIKESHSSFVRDSLALWFKKIIAYLSSNPHVPVFSSFRCIRGSIARAAAATHGVDTYFDVSLSWFTDRIGYGRYKLTDKRNQSGSSSSGYSLWGLIRHGKRLVLSSKLKFLRLIILMGVLAFLFSIAYSFWILSKLYMGEEIAIQGWSSTIISIYFFGGLSCLFLGIIIESLSEVLLKSKGKPAFFVVDRSSDKKLKAIFGSL